MGGMRPRVELRNVSEEERELLESGLRSSESFVLRRSQILLASARGERVAAIARALSCNDQTVRNAIHAFNAKGVAALQAGSSRPHQTRDAFDAAALGQLKEMLQHSPRAYGKESSVWTLALAAEVSYEQGLTKTLVSDETIRRAVKRLGWSWKRAKRWISSPDPAYERKKNDAIS